MIKFNFIHIRSYFMFLYKELCQSVAPFISIHITYLDQPLKHGAANQALEEQLLDLKNHDDAENLISKLSVPSEEETRDM